jgi:hypothetical protein
LKEKKHLGDPTAKQAQVEDDIKTLRKLSPEQLRDASEQVVKFYVYRQTDKTVIDKIGVATFNSANRFIKLGVIPLIFSGIVCLDEFVEILVHAYDFCMENAKALIEPVKKEISSIRQVLIYELLEELVNKLPSAKDDSPKGPQENPGDFPSYIV